MNDCRELSLSVSFRDSINENLVDTLGEYAEVGLDEILEDGVLKDIPFISTAIAIYRIGNSIKERHNLKKIAIFITEINNNLMSVVNREKYYNKFKDNERFRERELEYLLVIIDRYIDYDKPKLLAKLYLSYLENNLSWNEFLLYSATIDRFLQGDFETLCKKEACITQFNIVSDSILRLISLGLMIETQDNSCVTARSNGHVSITPDSLSRTIKKEKIYAKTAFGEKLHSIFTI